MAVLSISRQFGAGGKTLGEMVAKRLGYEFLHETMLDELAHKLDLGQEPTWQPDGSLLHILSSLGPANFIDRYLKDDNPDWDEKSHIEALTKVISGLAEMDNVVILGRGSQFILRDHPDTVRVLLVARLEDRIEFMQKRYGFERAQAEKMIKRADKRRAKFLRQFYPSEPNESTLYHMVVNTSLLPLERAAGQIFALVAGTVERKARPIWD